MRSQTVNYLHYGDSLNYFAHIDLSNFHGISKKEEFISSIFNGTNRNDDVVEIIRGYQKRSTTINLNSFKRDLRRSLAFRQMFCKLGCRGFSYKIYEHIGLCIPFRLREEINLRMALMSAPDLFYPQRVKAYLRRMTGNHYFRKGFPSIAFALGTEIHKEWYIFVLQSDLIKAPSYVREHFRGWRKVLFANIVRLAVGRVDHIYLNRSEVLLECCYPAYSIPETVPESWKVIYDRTAEDFRMKPVRVNRHINVQTFRRLPPVFSNVFYRLKMTKQVIKEIHGIFGSNS